MTRQQAEQFINAYNMLMTITTSGNDTKTMAQVLTIMEQLADSIQLIEDQAPPFTITPAEENANIEDVHVEED